MSLDWTQGKGNPKMLAIFDRFSPDTQYLKPLSGCCEGIFNEKALEQQKNSDVLKRSNTQIRFQKPKYKQPAVDIGGVFFVRKASVGSLGG